MNENLTFKITPQVLYQKQFNGRFSCCFCTTEGKLSELNHTKICFPITGVAGPQRTQKTIVQAIRNQTFGFEKGKFTHFFKLEYFSPNFFVGIDIMHNILLGVAKSLFKKLFEKGSTYFLSDKECSILQCALAAVKLPPNFHRKMPSKLKNLKAMDILLILLYGCDLFSFVAAPFPQLLQSLKEIVILSFEDSLELQDVSCLKSLIRDFRKLFQATFGESKMSHNIHMMLHLHRDILLFGPVGFHSLFSFEGFNHELAKMTKTTNNYDRKQLANFNAESILKKYLNKLFKFDARFKTLYKNLKENRRKKNPYVKISKYFFSKNEKNFAELNDGRKGKIELLYSEDDFDLVFTEASSKIVSIIQQHQIAFQLVKTHGLKRNFMSGELEKTDNFEKVANISQLF